MTARDLLGLPRRELMSVLRNGHAIEPQELDGWRYNGVSLGLPAFIERLTWKKFGKTFFRDLGTGLLRGWNIRMQQNSLDDPWLPQTKNGVPVTFGPYHVNRPQPLYDYDCGLTVDYSQSGTAHTAMSRVRDPLVAVEKGRAELLLGWSYVLLGKHRIATPSFFSLQRGSRIQYVPSKFA